MTTRKNGAKRTRQRYPEEFKDQAVKLSESVGTTAAARELGIQTSQIYDWRMKIRHAESTSEAENRLLAENARLKRELIEQRDELALIKKPHDSGTNQARPHSARTADSNWLRTMTRSRRPSASTRTARNRVLSGALGSTTWLDCPPMRPGHSSSRH